MNVATTGLIINKFLQKKMGGICIFKIPGYILCHGGEVPIFRLLPEDSVCA